MDGHALAVLVHCMKQSISRSSWSWQLVFV